MSDAELSKPIATEKRGNNLIPIGDIFDEVERKKKEAIAETAERVLKTSKKLPNALEAEKGLLSGLLLDRDAYDKIALEGLKADDFYHPAHGTIFGAMQRLHEKSEPIDTVTVVEELLRMQKLEQIGGPGTIAELEALFPSAANVSSYARLIQDKASLRHLIKTSSEIVNAAFSQDRPVADIIDEAEKEILTIREDCGKKGVTPIHDLVQAAIKHFDSLSKNKNPITGISSGFLGLDKLTCGFQDGELIVVAGRPSMGKTAIMLNIASYAALKAHAPTAFFSLEMGSEQLIQRLIGAEARIDLSRLRRGLFEQDEFSKLVKAAGVLGEAPMYIDETPALSIMEFRNKARRMVHKYGVKLIIIDYLQLMSGPQGYDNKATEVGEISKGLKSIARELRVPVITLSQLNRGVESRTDKRPMMSDLRESGAIEQDADVIAFLYREEYYLRDKTPDDKLGITELIVSKNRNGPTGTVELKFFNNITRFVDLEKDHEEY